jgi:predicted nuclease of predicted toxin-antitoxin system
MAAGHQVAFLNKTMARGSSDPLVCVIADINDAVLVALDGDMKRIAQGYGVGGRKFLKMGLISLAMSLTPPAG